LGENLVETFQSKTGYIDKEKIMTEKKQSVEATVKNIRRKSKKKYSAEEKIRIVLEGLRGEMSIAGLCRKEGINQNSYYKWSKEFLEAGKQRLAGNTSRQATSNEVKELRKELEQMKMMVAELSLKNRVLKKSLLGLENPLDD
jgi:transposase